MKILSIDVGMKNLAICLFNIKDNLEYEIELWDVLNLCNDKNFLCIGEKKNGILCGKKARFCKDNEYYCKIHAKNRKYKIPPSDLNIKKIKKMKLTKLKEIADKYNFKYEKKCKKIILCEKICFNIECKYLDNISIKKTKDFNLVQYGRNLKNEFNKILKDIKIDGIIIENQIGPLALRMKTLQGMIMQHFIEKDIPLVEEVSASNKLKEFLGKSKTTYTERKKASIKFTHDILIKNNNLQNWLEHFNKHKKKDDLADSFLQGRWYLKNTILKSNE